MQFIAINQTTISLGLAMPFGFNDQRSQRHLKNLFTMNFTVQ